MKKIIVTLAVLLLASPAMATVTITVVAGPGPNDVTIGFTDGGETQRVRAIALDVQVNDPNVVIGEVNCVSADYYIYPGSISINASGDVTDYGTCAGEQDGNTMASEQGSLYVDGVDPYPVPGDLFIVTLAGCTLVPDGNVVVSVSENQLRGGIVMEDPEVPPVSVDVSATATVTVCVISGCTCWGDVAGDVSPAPDGKVNTSDLAAFMGLLGPLGPPFSVGSVPAGWECMDIAGDISPASDGNLNTSDLAALMGYLGPLGPPFDGPCMPAPPSGP